MDPSTPKKSPERAPTWEPEPLYAPAPVPPSAKPQTDDREGSENGSHVFEIDIS